MVKGRKAGGRKMSKGRRKGRVKTKRLAQIGSDLSGEEDSFIDFEPSTAVQAGTEKERRGNSLRKPPPDLFC